MFERKPKPFEKNLKTENFGKKIKVPFEYLFENFRKKTQRGDSLKM